MLRLADRVMFAVVVLLVLLPCSCISEEEREEILNKDPFKCLECKREKQLMCFTNTTCNTGAGEKYCFYYKWKVETDLIATDLNQREWGCTESLASCKAGCKEGECTDYKCCYADVRFKDQDLKLNYTEYEECVYGRSGGEEGRKVGSWGVVMVTVLLAYTNVALT